MKVSGKRTTKRLLTVILAFLVASAFSFAVPQETFAASKKCKKPRITYADGVACNAISLMYEGAGKNASTYFVYMKAPGAKKYKLVKKTKYRWLTDGIYPVKITKLKPNTKYVFKVRAAKAYYQLQYYNTKTKKWQTKKPKKKHWKGKKTRKVLKYKWYSAYSKTKTVKTLNHSYNLIHVPVNFYSSGTTSGKCKYCSVKYPKKTFGTPGWMQDLSAKAEVMQTNGTAGAFISWTAATGATGYIVERSVDDNAYTDVYYSKEPYYFDGDVLAGKKYTYRITAYANLLGNTTYGKNTSTVELTGNSPFPESLQPNTKTNRAAAAPIISETTGLTATPSYMTVKLSWKAVAQAKKYEIFCNGESTGEATGTSYTVSDLTPKTAYSFTVVAKRDGLTGDASIVVGTKTTATPVPKNIKTVSGWDNVTLSWDPVEGAEGYYIRSDETDIKERVTDTTYTATDLSPNTKYTFYIQAYLKGKYSSLEAGKVTAKTGFQAPGNIHATKITDTSAVIVWDPVEGADRYRVYKGQGTSYVEVTSCSLKVASLTPDTTYTYYVVAGSEGNFAIKDEENKVTFKTVTIEDGFIPNQNITMTYGGKTFYLGQPWSTTLENSLKSASNGFEQVTRPGYAHELLTYTTHTATEYFYDINDYSDFLVVKVADGKIIGWETNGLLFGTYYGQDVAWGDKTLDYPYGSETAYRTNSSPCSNIFTDIDRGDTVVGGFNFLVYPRTTLDIEAEKKIGFHYINAYRAAAGLDTVEYSDALDGHNYTWTGDIYGKHYSNTRYGAQPLAETLNASNDCTHGTEDLKQGPLAGQSALERGYVIKAAAGIERDQEIISTGGLGESSLAAYMDSPNHLVQIVNPNVKKIGIGICGGYNAVQFNWGP